MATLNTVRFAGQVVLTVAVRVFDVGIGARFDRLRSAYERVVRDIFVVRADKDVFTVVLEVRRRIVRPSGIAGKRVLRANRRVR